jgi:hypothetical protein
VNKCDLYLGEVEDENDDRIGNDDSVNSSACSTPTPTSSSAIDNTHGAENNDKSEQGSKERYDYEIDPDIGVIV